MALRTAKPRSSRMAHNFASRLPRESRRSTRWLDTDTGSWGLLGGPVESTMYRTSLAFVPLTSYRSVVAQPESPMYRLGPRREGTPDERDHGNIQQREAAVRTLAAAIGAKEVGGIPLDRHHVECWP